MSLIIHRCTDCGHPEHNHTAASCTLGTCRCSKSAATLSAPEVVPTFDGRGQRIERIIPPGQGIRSESGGSIIPGCNCEECTALFAEVTS